MVNCDIGFKKLTLDLTTGKIEYYFSAGGSIETKLTAIEKNFGNYECIR